MCDEYKEYKVFLEIIDKQGYCAHKHKAGQKFEVSITDPGGLCGTFYAAALPWITTFQFGGNIPFCLFGGWDKDTYQLYCPDVANMVTARMTRTFDKVWDEEELQRILEEAALEKGE